MEFHEVAEIFPLMNDEEMSALRADIKANGLREPIWTYQGKIIDGRNRYRACMAEDIEPVYREWEGEESDLVAFVVSQNLNRRHLTSGQKAVIALKVLPLLEERAKQRQLATLKQNQSYAPSLKNFSNGEDQKEPTISQLLDPGDGRNEKTAAAQAAALIGSNPHYVSDLKRIEQKAPEMVEEIFAGRVKIPEAKRYVNLPDERKAKIQEAMTQDRVSLTTALQKDTTENSYDREQRVATLRTKITTLYRTIFLLRPEDLDRVVRGAVLKKELADEIKCIQDKLGQMDRILAKENPKLPTKKPATKRPVKKATKTKTKKKPTAKKGSYKARKN